jgi:hypothetical protein
MREVEVALSDAVKSVFAALVKAWHETVAVRQCPDFFLFHLRGGEYVFKM